MSRRRYISTNISLDTKVNKLAMQCGDFAVLLYTWMIPHAEDSGQITADPEELLFMVVPGRRDKTAEDIVNAIDGMISLGLIYELKLKNGKTVLQFPPEAFYRYQTYIPQPKRTPDNIAEEEDKQQDHRETAKNAEENNISAKQTNNTASPSPSLSPSPSPSKERYSNFASDDAAPSQADSPTKSKAPVQEIVELYNTICTSLPKVQKVTQKRSREIRTRWRSYPDIETFRRLFQKAQDSDFLSGGNGRWTGCNFDWLIKEANMVKVLEGCYDSRAGPASRGVAQPASSDKFNEEARIIDEVFGGDIREYGFWVSAGKPPIEEWRRKKHHNQRYYAQRHEKPA